ncbi:MAG: putative DNA binding domain-containing protein [Clostridia bacterium]|nr:putative DNA binding domain-containing protein [Clostridia bacterium]
MTPEMPEELLCMMRRGEGPDVEFKKSETELSKDVYETVCAFSNRDGGHVFLGVKDNGAVVGVRDDVVDKEMKEFVVTINNDSKVCPPLFITPEKYDVDGKTVIYINVPVGDDVCRCGGKIFDRSGEADIDITSRSYDVYRLYAGKHEKVYLDRVTGFGIEDLRPDLIERARKMTNATNTHHPWQTMKDEELLRSAGLILRDGQTGREGVTLAAILLFGQDITIMSALPFYKTDALVRVEDKERYDDRDVVITNLLDSFDRLTAFGEKHLSDTFHLDGTVRVSCRDIILREIIVNLLCHRDFSSEYTAKFVIEKEQMFTENASKSRRKGVLDLRTAVARSKNPPLAKVFREIGLADELGSGMRKTFKYTKMYSEGAEPTFSEGAIFRTTVPLCKIATIKVGPGTGADLEREEDKRDAFAEHDEGASGGRVSEEGKEEEVQSKKVAARQAEIMEYCLVPRSREELQNHFGLASSAHFKEIYLDPLIEAGKIKMTTPEKPNSRNQKYVKA